MASNLIAFPKMFSNSGGRVLTKDGDEANRQALKCLLLTTIGELLGDPLYGCNLKSFIFEIESDYFRVMLQENIAAAANKYIKNISVTNTEIAISTESNFVVISVYYFTKSTGSSNCLELKVQSDGLLTTE